MYRMVVVYLFMGLIPNNLNGLNLYKKIILYWGNYFHFFYINICVINLEHLINFNFILFMVFLNFKRKILVIMIYSNSD